MTQHQVKSHLAQDSTRSLLQDCYHGLWGFAREKTLGVQGTKRHWTFLWDYVSFLCLEPQEGRMFYRTAQGEYHRSYLSH